jgi:acyl-CoA synthetase (AMP-forming)/AMP-acid ligase II
MSIGNILSRNAAQFPNNEALIFEGQRFTWAQLNQRVNRLANAFLKLGLKKGDKVALWSENHNAVVETNYALAKIGVVFFPVLSRLMPEDIGTLINLSDAKALVFHNDVAPAVSDLRPDLKQVEHYIQITGETLGFAQDFDTFSSEGSPDEPGVTVSPDDLYIFLCTGGTTGISKIAMLTHANAMWAVYTTINAMNLTEKDTGIQVLPLFHVIINNCLNSLMAAGARVVLEPRFDPVQYMKNMHEEKVTVSMVVPPFLFNWIAAFPDAMAFDQSHVRAVATAAATFPTDLKQAFQKHFPNAEIYYTYGLTESSGGNATVLDPSRMFDKDGSIGVVNPVLNYRIVSPEGKNAQVNEAGELWLKGPSVIQGYYRRDDETKLTFGDGWLRTGDVVRQDEDGFLYFVDRLKEMIKTGGENVFAKEVEDALLTHPKVQEVGVFGLPDEKWGEKIHAAVVLKPGESMTEEELAAFAKDNLPGFKCPKEIYFLDVLPRNPSGKVLKYKLKEDYQTR